MPITPEQAQAELRRREALAELERRGASARPDDNWAMRHARDVAGSITDLPRNLKIGFLEGEESLLRAVERRGLEKPIPDDVIRAAGFEPSGKPWEPPAIARVTGKAAENVAATKRRAIRKQEPVTLAKAPIRRLTRPVQQALPQFGTMIAASALAGTPLAGIAAGAEMAAGSTFQQQKETHGDIRIANMVADLSGLAEAAGEALVFPRFIKGLSKGIPLREAFLLIAENAGQEGATGFAQRFLEVMGEQKAKGVDMKKAAKLAFNEGVKAIPENAWVGGAMGVLPAAGGYARARQIAQTRTPGPAVYTAGTETGSAAVEAPGPMTAEGAAWDVSEGPQMSISEDVPAQPETVVVQKVPESATQPESPVIDEPQPEVAAPGVAPEGDRPPISTRNVDTAAVRAEEDLPPLVGGQRRTLGEHQALWTEAAPGPEVVDAITDEMLKRPRALTPAEEQGFRLRIEDTRGRYDALVAEAAKLEPGSDALRVNIAAREELRSRNDKLTRATRMAGTEWSHTGLSRQNLNSLLEDETSPLAMTALAEEKKGDKLAPEEQAGVETDVAAVKEVAEKAKTRRQKTAKRNANRAIARGRSRYAKMTEAEKDAELADLIAKVASDPENTDRYIYQMAMNIGSRPGVHNVGDVAARLQEQFDWINVYTLSDAIAGAQRRQKVEADLLKEALASLRREAKTNVNLRTTINEVRWHLQEGTVPEPKRKLRKETTDIRALRETLVYYQEQLKTSEPARKAVVEKQIARLKARIANGDFTSPAEDLPISEELRTLTEERNKLRAEIAKRKREARAGDVTEKIKRLNDQIAALEKRVATGHYQKLPRPAVEKGPEELDSMRAQKRALEEQLSQIAQRQTTLDNLRARIRTLQEHLNAGTVPQKAPRIGPDPDPLAVRLREIAAILQEQITNSKAAQKARLERVLDRVRAQIANGDYGPKPGRESKPLRDPELEHLEYQIGQARSVLRRRIAALDPWTKRLREHPWRTTTQPFREVQAWKSAFDFSALMKQGGIALRAHPIRTLRRVPAAVRAMFDPETAFKINNELHNGDRAWYYKRVGLDLTDYDGGLTAREEEMASMWVENHKYLGAGLRASNRGFVTLLNVIRVDAFNAMEGSFAGEGGLSLDESRAIAMYVNVMTGRGSMLGLEKAAPVLNGLLWSPRYTLSRFQFEIGMPLWQRKSSWRVRKAVAKEYVRYLAGMAATYALYTLVFGGVIEEDPRSADFGKIKIGNTRLDPLSGLAQWTVLLARQITGKIKTGAGEVKPLSPTDPEFPYRGSTRLSVLGRFGRSKLGFFPGKTVDTLDGKNFIGQPWSWEREIAMAPVPLGFEDVLRLMEDQGVPRGLALETLNLLGDSVQVYDEKEESPGSGKRRVVRRRR